MSNTPDPAKLEGLREAMSTVTDDELKSLMQESNGRLEQVGQQLEGYNVNVDGMQDLFLKCMQIARNMDTSTLQDVFKVFQSTDVVPLESAMVHRHHTIRRCYGERNQTQHQDNARIHNVSVRGAGQLQKCIGLSKNTLHKCHKIVAHM